MASEKPNARPAEKSGVAGSSDGSTIAEKVDQSSTGPVDPFDLDTLRSTPLADIMVERAVFTIPVRRPGRNEFFRVHPGEDYVVDSLVIEHENGLDRMTYWVAPSLRAALQEEGRLVRLFTCVSRRDVTFLWPAKLPDGDGGGRQWAATGLQVAEVAKTRWVKLRGNRDAGMYEAIVAKGELPEPNWADATKHGYYGLIKLAFTGDRVIDSLDHPVVRELEGRV